MDSDISWYINLIKTAKKDREERNLIKWNHKLYALFVSHWISQSSDQDIESILFKNYRENINYIIDVLYHTSYDNVIEYYILNKFNQWYPIYPETVYNLYWDVNSWRSLLIFLKHIKIFEISLEFEDHIWNLWELKPCYIIEKKNIDFFRFIIKDSLKDKVIYDNYFQNYLIQDFLKKIIWHPE